MQIYTRFKTLEGNRRPPGRRRWLWGVLLLGVIAVAAWYWRAPLRDLLSPPDAPLQVTLPTPITNAPALTPLPAPGVAPASSTHRVFPPATPTRLPVVVGTNLVTLPGGKATSEPGAFTARPPQNNFEIQLALTRLGLSSGPLDGVIGSQTRAAVRIFQRHEGLPETGHADAATRQRLMLTLPPFAGYAVTEGDLARLQPLSPSWLGKSQQSALDYESLLEMVAEKTQAHPLLIERINPGINWTNLTAGTVVQVPNIAYPPVRTKAALVRVSLGAKTLRAFDGASNLLAHFPCSIAARVEKRPAGELRVAVVAANPDYTFDPELFPNAPETREQRGRLILPPGPNNPVGVAWIGLDRAGYGIHGTPHPEQVGRTESLGCFRLANWNAEYLLKLVSVGTPVLVEP